MLGEIVFREFARLRDSLKAKKGIFCVAFILIDAVLIDPEFLFLDHPLIVSYIDGFNGHLVFDLPVFRDIYVDGIADIDVISTLLPMVFTVFLQTLSQAESAALGSYHPFLVLFRHDMASHVDSIVVGNDVHITIHRSGYAAKDVKAGGVLTFLNTAKVGGIDVSKLCDILGIHPALHPKALDTGTDTLAFISTVRAIPENAGPAAALVHTTKNRPHNDGGVALVVFVEECSNNLTVLLLKLKWDYSGESQRETVTLWRFNRHPVTADELTFCLCFHNSATGLTLNIKNYETNIIQSF